MRCSKSGGGAARGLSEKHQLRSLGWGGAEADVERDCPVRMGPGRQLRPIPIAREGMTGVDMNPADNKAVFEVCRRWGGGVNPALEARTGSASART